MESQSRDRPRFDARLLAKYGVNGPRYTSYPTATAFHEGFDEIAYRQCAALSNEDVIPRPLSLYVHLPFCRSLCYYCACNKKITQHARHGVEYLHSLDLEIALQAGLFDRDREVVQLHFGGGTPTFFDDAQLERLMRSLGDHFNLAPRGRREFSIELDPRTVDSLRLERLSELGFDRLSMGVQDFDAEVQRAVNRIQDQEHTMALVAAARASGFASVSLDLIYGLPRQTTGSFTRTIDTVIGMRPDRISVYNYAHLPQLFRAQQLIRTEDVPLPEVRLELLRQTIDRLTGAGYLYIGMDHFALPGDELSRARADGRLQRNFQGYSTGAECDIVGLGVSAIGRIGNCYVQNHKELRLWQATLGTGQLPVWRGLQLGREDQLRRAVIESIMCHGQVEFADIEDRFGLDFTEHFAPEMERLLPLQADGLLEFGSDGFRVTALGMLLLRVVAMVFDEHFSRPAAPGVYSRVI